MRKYQKAWFDPSPWVRTSGSPSPIWVACRATVRVRTRPMCGPGRPLFHVAERLEPFDHDGFVVGRELPFLLLLGGGRRRVRLPRGAARRSEGRRVGSAGD